MDLGPVPVYLRTNDHPAAQGRRPGRQEREWIFEIPLEDGGKLFLSMGKVGRNALKEMLCQDEAGSEVLHERTFTVDVETWEQAIEVKEPEGENENGKDEI